MAQDKVPSPTWFIKIKGDRFLFATHKTITRLSF